MAAVGIRITVGRIVVIVVSVSSVVTGVWIVVAAAEISTVVVVLVPEVLIAIGTET